MTINDFGRKSFLTWPKGLKERIQKEIQMRKFRGLTKEGKWVYGYYYHWNSEGKDFIMQQHINSVDIIHIEVIPETVGQSTGLKDKKRTEEYPEGQEIYEGDILRLIYETLSLCGVVQQTERGKWELYKDEGNHVGIYHNIDRVEIIGNKWEHPDLMEQDNAR